MKKMPKIFRIITMVCIGIPLICILEAKRPYEQDENYQKNDDNKHKETFSNPDSTHKDTLGSKTTKGNSEDKIGNSLFMESE